ncbi:hypothetical protein ABMY37_22375 [Vibrio vulnificus]|uniref:hypothetical protein n=1 Tax=Vibrio TaxID=662 RepID=UPI0009B6A093|nr:MULTISPECIES: hypothetical protein [Vibrio]EHH0796081.1 hypothetical protein [Vibrio vulnificus]EIY8044171.1 hypothetical protein [Vibrio vulnificus]OQK32319.1 hypothetical protein XM72_u0078 [Vibrio vulnificus]TPA68563.1 hypothetical protein DXJ77_24890 [Vibrio parahaemolyticus]HAS8250682.1 hypothetical protein [Vibrio vulnificus]
MSKRKFWFKVDADIHDRDTLKSLNKRETFYVYKEGKSIYISCGVREELCHHTRNTLEEVLGEIWIVFNGKVVDGTCEYTL